MFVLLSNIISTFFGYSLSTTSDSLVVFTGGDVHDTEEQLGAPSNNEGGKKRKRSEEEEDSVGETLAIVGKHPKVSSFWNSGENADALRDLWTNLLRPSLPSGSSPVLRHMLETARGVFVRSGELRKMMVTYPAGGDDSNGHLRGIVQLREKEIHGLKTYIASLERMLKESHGMGNELAMYATQLEGDNAILEAELEKRVKIIKRLEGLLKGLQEKLKEIDPEWEIIGLKYP